MEKLEELSPTELLKLGNDIKAEHDALKDIIIQITHEIEKLENDLNNKILKLQQHEKDYVGIIEFIEK